MVAAAGSFDSLALTHSRLASTVGSTHSTGFASGRGLLSSKALLAFSFSFFTLASSVSFSFFEEIPVQFLYHVAVQFLYHERRGFPQAEKPFLLP